MSAPLNVRARNTPPLRMAVISVMSAVAVLVHGLAAAAPSEAKSYQVDEAWGGTRTSIGAVSVGPLVYVAYYNAGRELTVARLDTRSGATVRRNLPSVFGGWDAHNSIALAYDKQGFVHVAGNMHTTPLVYARMMKPNDIESFSSLMPMVGNLEKSVTYPKFFEFQDGALGFTYRSGASGNGEEIVNRFDGKQWVRHVSTPIFGSAAGGQKANAYHSGYVLGPDNAFHTAWVWRANRNAENNFNVNYARSSDLRNWEDSKGGKLTLPITPANTQVVADTVPPGSGLFNNVRIGFDKSGTPVISYVKHDGDGFTQLYHARPSGTSWEVARMTSFDARWDFEGAGTLPQKISFSGVKSEEGLVSETLRHWKQGSQTLQFDSTAMKLVQRAKQAGTPSRRCRGTQWTQNEFPITPTSPDSFKGIVAWRTLPRTTGTPLSCAAAGLGAECKMTSKLIVMAGVKAGSAEVPLAACD